MMKTNWMVVMAIWGLAVVGGSGQGVISNSNRDTARGVDAPVTCHFGPVGPDFVAQLYAGPTVDMMQPVGGISPFRAGAGAGYWNAPLAERTEGVVVPGVPPGQIACVQVVVWDSSVGDGTFEAAVNAGPEYHGKSTSIYEATAGEPGAPSGINFGMVAIPLCGHFMFLDGSRSSYPPVTRNDISVANDRSFFAFTTDGQRKSSYFIERSYDLLEWKPWIAVRGTMKLREAFSGELEASSDAYFRIRGDEQVVPVFAQLWNGDLPTDYSYRLVGTRPRDFGAADAPYYSSIQVVVRNDVVATALGTQVVDGVEQPATELDNPGDLSIPGMYAVFDTADVSMGRRYVTRLTADGRTPWSIHLWRLPGYTAPFQTATLLDFQIPGNP